MSLESYKKKQKPEDDGRLTKAALAGLGVTGALGARQSLVDHLREQAENKKVKGSRSWADFQSKLEPGDVVFHRRPHKFSANADLGKFELPLKESDVMMAAKGDPFYHSSVYRGKGIVTEAANWKDGIKNSRMWQKDIPEELKVYRPKVSDAEKTRALQFLDDMKGSPYKSEMDSVKHGARHLFGGKVPTGSSACKLGKGGTVCTELTSEAYPSVFKDRVASPKEMRAAKDLELVARYGKVAPVGLREQVLTKGVYPVLKNAKWGALAGALALGGMALSNSTDEAEDSALQRWKKKNQA